MDGRLNIDIPYFEGMVTQMYPTELQLNKANSTDTEASFLDLHLSISRGCVPSKIYDKLYDFDFDIVNFNFLDGDIPLPLPMVFIFLSLFGLQECIVIWLISTPVTTLVLANFSNRGIGIIKFGKLFSKFNRRHYA